MARIAIVTDSSSDLSPELLRDHNITMVPLNVQFGDDVFQDQVGISHLEFMERLKRSPHLPTTVQPAPGLFEEAYRRLANDHDQVLAVLISSKLSGTIQSALQARDAVADLIEVEVVDSLNASMGLGLQVLRAAALVSSGLGLHDVAAQMRSESSNYHLVFFVDTFEYLQRGERVGRGTSLLGSLIRLKPLLRVDEGQVVPFERTRTKARAIDGLKAFVKSFPTIAELAILYTTDHAEAAQLADELGTAFARVHTHVAELGPVIGMHVGPGAMGVCVVEREGS